MGNRRNNEHIYALVHVFLRSLAGYYTLIEGAKILPALDVHGSVHHSINHTEITNKMQSCNRIYYSNVS